MKSLTITRGVALALALPLLTAPPALAVTGVTGATGTSGATGAVALVHHHRHHHRTIARPAVSDAALAAQTGANTKLNLPGSSGTGHAATSGTGSSIVRTLVALLVVIALIYGISWILKQYKGGKSRATGTGLEQVASLPLGNNRSVSLVRVGNELVLLGVGDQQVTALRHYGEDDAVAAGIPIDQFAQVVEANESGARRTLRLPQRSQLPALPAGVHKPSLKDIGRRMVEQARQMTVRQ